MIIIILQRIYEEGDKRYLMEIPPGYKFDNNKNKFGDLILWFQIIDHARNKSKPIIFIMNERKEDWWHKGNTGKIIGPRPELVQEFINETGQDFVMYRMPQFSKYLDKYYKKLKKETIEEIDKFKSDSDINKENIEKLKALYPNTIYGSKTYQQQIAEIILDLERMGAFKTEEERLKQVLSDLQNFKQIKTPQELLIESLLSPGVLATLTQSLAKNSKKSINEKNKENSEKKSEKNETK